MQRLTKEDRPWGPVVPDVAQEYRALVASWLASVFHPVSAVR